MLTASRLRSQQFVAHFPIFYGWVVLGVASLGLILPFFGHNTTIGLFMDHFITDFGMDRTTVSGVLGLGGFLAALALPWIGKLIDRYGSRSMGLLAGGVFAVSLIALSLADSALVFFVLFVVMRGFGVGPLRISHSTVVVQWFRARRGRVMGITIIITWLFQGFYVPFVQQLLETYSWRVIWQWVGLGIGLVVVPFIWLLMRNRPENFGLLPDGEVVDDATEAVAVEESWTLAEARRTAVFWIFAIGRFLLPAIGSSLILHQVSIFGELGYEPAVAAQTFGTISVTAAVMSLFTGMLVDRVRPGLVMMLQLGTMSLTMVLAMTMTVPWMLVLYVMSFGTTIALGGVFDNAVWANLFGRENLGEIRGFVSTIMAFGAALGPVLVGWSFDSLGSYNIMLTIFVVLALIQMLLAFLAPRPRRKN